MKRTLVLAASAILGAMIVAAALLTLASELRAISGDLTRLAREVDRIGADVKSLADDLAVVTDTLTAPEGGATDEPCPSDVAASPLPGV